MAELKRIVRQEVTLTDSSRIVVEINVEIERELTSDEVWDIRKSAEDTCDILAETSYKQSDSYKKEYEENKKDLIGLFDGSSIFVEEIKNEYNNSWTYSARPWFIVTTSIGRIKLGWRKRVINIDWSQTILKSTAQDLFADEVVTKGDKYIHADNLEKAQEYITTLLNSK